MIMTETIAKWEDYGIVGTLRLMTSGDKVSTYYDDTGQIFYKTEGPGGEFKKLVSEEVKKPALGYSLADAHGEEKFEESLLSVIDNSLLNDNDAVYIRKVEGRLMWMKANTYGEKWRELTPNLAVKRLSGVEGREETLADLRDRMAVPEKKNMAEVLYKAGWYQNAAGALYNYNGEIWTDGSGANVGMTLGKYNGLEYLG